MAEIRWNPLIKDWVMIASNRQDRPQMPSNWCPFCSGSGNVPDDYDVLMYPNDFPALSPTPPIPDEVETSIFKVLPSFGKCEVILYSPEHTVTLPQLSIFHVKKLVDLWTERYIEIAKDEKVKFIFIFENRGEVVGVTMPHPHGQIYGYPFIPKKVELELISCKEHFESTGDCLICTLNSEEIEFKQRVIFQDEHFVVYLPFYSEYPYGVHIVSKRHIGNLSEFSEIEKLSFAKTLRNTVGMLDSLFDKPFPYMMCMYQSPVNYEDTTNYYHFHVEFFPPMRSENKIKFNASSETGAWAHCNTTAPEQKAIELQIAYERHIKKVND
ncbi:MAG: galactose-1-phosphate uridylyltransferase [Clostridiales bacterium]|nr:galactose-1-phosphate uridylyltransferase [Clostridiales bacterium]